MESRRRNIISSWVIAASFFVSCFSVNPAKAQVGTWLNHLAYHDIQQICKADNSLFVLASNGVYQYNLGDQSVNTYDKVNGLSDTYITHIAWNPQAKRLIAVYESTNIDLIETNGNITNISALYSKTMMQEKTVNSICIHQQFAYLATAFGIVKVDMKKAEISETYMLDQNIRALYIDQQTIFALTSSGTVISASSDQNILNKNNWTTTAVYDADRFAADNTDYEHYIETVKTIKTDGPAYNWFFEMNLTDGKLYTTGGYFKPGRPDNNTPGIIQVKDGDEWSVFEENINTPNNIRPADFNCIDVDPYDPRHVFTGGRTGLYEFYDGKFKKHYALSDGLLTAMSGTRALSEDYILINGIKFDREGNLWVFDSQSKVNRYVIEKNTTRLQTRYTPLMDYDGAAMSGLRHCILDSRGLIWLVNDHWNAPAVFCMQPSDSTVIKYSSVVNQDGTAYTLTGLQSIAEDLEGNIWVGTSNGLFYIDKSDVGKSSVTFNQVKVARNDGSDYADYLLNGVNISSIAIDGANRKWIGTSGAGLYLISADNNSQLQHFTTENSPLLSDYIYYLAVDGATGRVYISTEKGLCSYLSDATNSNTEMNKDNVYAYPNPVTPGYTGVITVTGLSFNADVKITSPSGALIAEGRSNGGTFTWDGNDRQGRRVASGVYMVITATSDGRKGTVCKIAVVN